jgi:hypothetical protein
MSQYASKTSVSVQTSRNDIEKTLKKYGADGFMYGGQETSAMIGFTIRQRRIRFFLSLPEKEQFTHTPERHLRRSPREIELAYGQAVRQRWRALLLIIKAKLEAIEAGVTTIEQEFMANLVLPNNQTVIEWVGLQLEEAYESGHMPLLLPAPSR